jgi:ketosteroid isomerase-like protein
VAGIIRSFFASFGDLEQTKALVDPAAQFIGVRARAYPALPLYGTFTGHEGLERFVGGLRRAFETQMFVIDADIENDEIGFACGRFEHRVRENDALLGGHWAVMCRFKDGRITYYRFYEDTAALEAAFGVRTEYQETVR